MPSASQRTECVLIRWLRYVLFSIGNVKPLFQALGAFPDCWKTHEVCDSTWIAAIEYLEICGIIVGQILVGIMGDWSVTLFVSLLCVLLSNTLQAWEAMGSDSGCHDHVDWSCHADSVVGDHNEWLGDLLRLVTLHLRYRRGWRISHDGHFRDGECRRFGQDLDEI